MLSVPDMEWHADEVDKELRVLLEEVALPTPLSPLPPMPISLGQDRELSESDSESDQVRTASWAMPG